MKYNIWLTNHGKRVKLLGTTNLKGLPSNMKFRLDNLVNTTEMIDVLGMPARRIREAAAEGRIPGAMKTHGNHWRIPRNARVEGRV